jgi:hypothetical protein
MLPRVQVFLFAHDPTGLASTDSAIWRSSASSALLRQP